VRKGKECADPDPTLKLISKQQDQNPREHASEEKERERRSLTTKLFQKHKIKP
jgi:hypothetical protein